MKAKHKLETLVEFTTTDGTLKHGKINGVLTKTTGVSYEVESEESFIPETSIMKAYKPVTPGKTRGPRKKKFTPTTTTQSTTTANSFNA